MTPPIQSSFELLALAATAEPWAAVAFAWAAERGLFAGPLPSNVVITDDQSLFGVDDTSSTFVGAGKVAYVDVLKFEFITPAGDPVSSPHATVGVGQNEFTYDDETSSLSLSLQVKVWPQLPSDWASRTGTFNLSAIEGAELEWNRGVDGRVTAIGNTFTARATYRGYPTHNSGFGRKTVTFAFEGMTVSQDFEVFFPKMGKNHPSCTTCPNCSNWFYYWREGEVCSIPDNARWHALIDGNSDIIGKYDGVTGKILLTDRAAMNEYGFSLSANLCISQMVYYVDHELANDTIEVNPCSSGMNGHRYYVCSRQELVLETRRTLALGGLRKGIACVASVIVHEQCHAEMYEEKERQFDTCEAAMAAMRQKKEIYGWDSKEYAEASLSFRRARDSSSDEDGDGVCDGGECSGYLGVCSDPRMPDTYGIAENFRGYSSNGDEETRARWIEAQTPSDRFRVSCDWCDPGCQHEEPFGP